MSSASSSAPTQPVITTSSSTSLQTSSMHPSSSSTTHPTLFQTSSMHPSSSSTTHPTLFQTSSMLTSSSSTTHPTRTSSYNTLLPLATSAVSIHSSQAGQRGSESSAVIPSSTILLTKPTMMSSNKPRLSMPVAMLPASSTVVILILPSPIPTKPEDVCSVIY